MTYLYAILIVSMLTLAGIGIGMAFSSLMVPDKHHKRGVLLIWSGIGSVVVGVLGLIAAVIFNHHILFDFGNNWLPAWSVLGIAIGFGIGRRFTPATVAR